MAMPEKLIELDKKAQKDLREVFDSFEEISYINSQRVLENFKKNRVSESLFAGSTGYGYGDAGRDALDNIFAGVFESEAAFARHNIVNGTQAISIALFGVLRPGDVMISITGSPYDTLSEVIGNKTKNGDGSLADFGVDYDEVPMKDGKVNYEAVKMLVGKYGKRVKMLYIQRSKGYENRPTFSAEEIGEIVDFCHSISDACVFVDNCYGEFCDEHEPTYYGADLMAGSLIKNPGGGIAKTGGYVAGKKRYVELASYRLTTVGIGLECGATLDEKRDMYRGFFLAPHVVCQAKKTAAFAAYIFNGLGFESYPSYKEPRHDIIQTVILGSAEKLCSFCQGIQSASPVDSYVTPEPWDMPGYADKVIMAAGTFISGASIELSADGPLREPYIAYFQGGLTYESGRAAILAAAEKML